MRNNLPRQSAGFLAGPTERTPRPSRQGKPEPQSVTPTKPAEEIWKLSPYGWLQSRLNPYLQRSLFTSDLRMQDKTISIIRRAGSRLHPLTADRAACVALRRKVPHHRLHPQQLSLGLRRILILTCTSLIPCRNITRWLVDLQLSWAIHHSVPPQMRTGESWYSGTARRHLSEPLPGALGADYV